MILLGYSSIRLDFGGSFVNEISRWILCVKL